MSYWARSQRASTANVCILRPRPGILYPCYVVGYCHCDFLFAYYANLYRSTNSFKAGEASKLGIVSHLHCHLSTASIRAAGPRLVIPRRMGTDNNELLPSPAQITRMEPHCAGLLIVCVCAGERCTGTQRSMFDVYSLFTVRTKHQEIHYTVRSIHRTNGKSLRIWDTV
ncbi:hypothetical protein BC835DRAFT_296323 [Cytidiella melzeri]|nr:hypothetical protein BC835DRAFT_296323 [Cytidiella melzeri]